MDKIWNATLEVDTKNFEFNFNQIKKYIGEKTDIMPVFKDNAYGSFLNQNIELLNKLNIKIIGVAIVDEGIKLRELGYKGEIVVLNQPLLSEISEASKYDLTISIASIRLLSQINETLKIHIELETGMGRTGLSIKDIPAFLSEVKKKENINVTGLFTHFSSSDSDENYTKNQIELFNKGLQLIQQEIELKYIHCCNSAGIINFPEAHFNLVRPGLILLGYYPDERLKNKIKLKPVLKLKSKISFLKEVPKNTFIGYNNSFCTNDKSIIATIPLGYADGIRRSMSNTGCVFINGKFAPIVGKVCMDCFMADVTGIDVKENDDVFIWDNENISIENIAEIGNTINYEILTGISEQVEREFIY